MISGGRFFEIYVAINRHFADGSCYDYFKYNGKINVTNDSFLARKDKYFFEKAAGKCGNESAAIGFCVANLIAGNKYIIKFTVDSYHSWLAYRDALDYKFTEELKKYKSTKMNSQSLLEMVLTKKLSLEFVILLNQVIGNDYV